VRTHARTWGLALLAGVAAFALWWRLFDGPRVASLALRANPGFVLAGFALMGAAQLLRLLRWHALLNRLGRVPLPRTFHLLYASELLNNVLPVKVGDLGRAVALAGRSPGFTVGSAAASMVVDRLWGVATRLLALPLLLVIPSRLPASLRASIGIFAALLVLAVASLFVWGRYREALARKGAPLLRFVPAPARDATARTLRAFADASVEVGMRAGLAAALAALSAGSLLAQAAGLALLFRAVGHPVPLAVAVAGTALLDLLAVVPAPPAGVGTTEWYATLIFTTALGQPLDATAAAALLYHAAWLLIVFVAGAASLPAVAEMLPRRAPETPA
jgi:glycosyltransferase 2 family protein